MTKNEKQKRHYDWLNQVKEEMKSSFDNNNNNMHNIWNNMPCDN